MPTKRYKKPYRRSRKKTYKRYKRRRYKTSVPKGLVPNTKLVKHRYVEPNVVLNPTTGGMAGVKVFSANGMFDPNISGVGHQPMLFDQMTELYKKYTVIGAKLRFVYRSAEAYRPESSTYEPSIDDQIVACSLEESKVPDPNIFKKIEQGRTKWRNVTPTPGPGSSGSLTVSCNPSKHLGYSKPMSEDSLKGTDSQNPETDVFFQLCCAPTDGTTNTNGVKGMVIIDYTAVWSDPKIIGQS